MWYALFQHKEVFSHGSPAQTADIVGVCANWNWITLGRKVAKPTMSAYSIMPIIVNKIYTGFFTRHLSEIHKSLGLFPKFVSAVSASPIPP